MPCVSEALKSAFTYIDGTAGLILPNNGQRVRAVVGGVTEAAHIERHEGETKWKDRGIRHVSLELDVTTDDWVPPAGGYLTGTHVSDQKKLVGPSAKRSPCHSKYSSNISHVDCP